MSGVTLVRLLLNQATRLEKAARGRRALLPYSRIMSIASDYPHHWWARARLNLADDNVAAARDSLAVMLEMTREPVLRVRANNTLGALSAW